MSRPLEKASCRGCGYCFPKTALSAEEIAGFYASDDYTVLRADTSVTDGRARTLGILFARFRPKAHPPGSVLEIGCGGGALLSELGRQWPQAAVYGIEPSPLLAGVAKAQGHEVFAGSLEDFQSGRSFDLITSVNVLEHLGDPAAALATVARLLVPEGLAIMVVPDGEMPGMELLFHDHISSFSIASMKRFASESGLCMRETAALDGALQEFRLFVFAHGTGGETAGVDNTPLADARERFLLKIRESSAMPIEGRFCIFGAGEMVDLLNAYCPDLVQCAEAIVVDTPALAELHGKPVRALCETEASARFLLAVHPRSIEAVRDKLMRLGHQVFVLDFTPEVP